MSRLTPAFTVVLLLLTGCPGGGDSAATGEPHDLSLAPTLAVSDSLRAWPAAAAPGQGLVLYLDRSGSMKGFLDPDYPARARTDYRSVIDGLVVGLSPTAAYGFGNAATAVEPSLGILGDKSFYSDNNSELEDALALVRADSARQSSHVIVGDGRRSDPNVANEQYVQMRRLAQGWVEGGGTFMAAASLAPFQPVPGDPAGCRAPSGGTREERGEGREKEAHADADGRERCPLYAFAYVAPGDETRIAATLAERFEHLFVWPLPAVPPANLGARAAAQSPAMTLESGWNRARDRTPILRVRGAQASNEPLRATLSLRDTTSAPGRAAAAALHSQGLRPVLAYRAFREGSGDWEPMSGKGAVMRPAADDPFAVDFLTRGAAGARYLYRLELYPDGVPNWLDAFDAENAGDAVRTYGLGRLFEAFKLMGERSPAPVARIYAVVN